MKEKRKRNKQMIVRLTQQELTEFSEKMNKAKAKRRSDFIMALVRKKPIIVPDGLPEITAELKRQGNNLNQAVKKINQTGTYSFNFISTIEKCDRAYESVCQLVCDLNGRK
ncbi:MAG: hypothetical protein J1F11_11520 [Oscillospiraceae bacterium]|nr:hypothetical protein [Oscillospiraceae bacterium]